MVNEHNHCAVGIHIFETFYGGHVTKVIACLLQVRSDNVGPTCAVQHEYNLGGRFAYLFGVFVSVYFLKGPNDVL